MRRALLLVLSLIESLVAARARAATSLDELYVSPATPVQLDVGSVQVSVQDGTVVRYGASGSTLADLGPLPGGLGIESFHVDAGGARYFSVDAAAVLGTLPVQTRDVVRWNGSRYAKHFDGAARGVPAGLLVDAFAIDSGADLLSFNGPFAIGGLAIEPGDLVEWRSTGLPVLRFDASAQGIPFGLNLDAVAALSNGHLLLSFNGSGSLPGGPTFQAADALEFDPATSSWQPGVIGSDFDPDWSSVDLDALHAVVGTANVNVPAAATVRVVPIDPDAPPRSYELRLDCGAHRITRLNAGILLPPNVAASAVSIGGCSTAGCTGGGFGPSIDAAAAVVDFPPGIGGQRGDAIYLQLPGAAPSGLICAPGQEALLADVEIRGGSGPLPSPAPTPEGAGATLRESGAALKQELMVFESGAADPAYEVRVRRALGDSSGLLYEVLIRGTTRLHQLGLALLPPDGVGTGLGFAGCSVPAGPNNARSCLGATALGPHVDPSLSSTLGPASGLAPLGGHPGALYLRLTGKTLVFGSLPALDLPGAESRWTLLGLLAYAPSVPTADRTPPVVLVAGLGPADGGLTPTLDEFGAEIDPIGGPSGSGTPGIGGNIGDDGIPDDGQDVCLGSDNNLDNGGLGPASPPDGIGDDCQCGDVAAPEEGDPDGIIEQEADVAQIRGALAGSADLAAEAALKCSVEGEVDATLGPVGLRRDCSIDDVVVLTRLLEGELVNGQQQMEPGMQLDDPFAFQKCAAP
jgi:hypothetical protein